MRRTKKPVVIPPRPTAAIRVIDGKLSVCFGDEEILRDLNSYAQLRQLLDEGESVIRNYSNGMFLLLSMLYETFFAKGTKFRLEKLEATNEILSEYKKEVLNRSRNGDEHLPFDCWIRCNILEEKLEEKTGRSENEEET